MWATVISDSLADPVAAARRDTEVAAGRCPFGERLGQLPQIGHDRRVGAVFASLVTPRQRMKTCVTQRAPLDIEDAVLERNFGQPDADRQLVRLPSDHGHSGGRGADFYEGKALGRAGDLEGEPCEVRQVSP